MQKVQQKSQSIGSDLIAASSLKNHWRITVTCLITVHFVTLSCFMLARVAALHTPTYDQGLFTQMFHYMCKTGLPLTTLERDMLLSHFNVHISPIFYLYLPFFALWKSAYCLELLQIITVLLALIPLSQLLKYELKLKATWRYTTYLLYVYAPAITGANFYDVHENCFLPVCLFALLLANWRKNKKQVLLWTCLTLAIKEDAMLYVVCLGVYFFCKDLVNYYERSTARTRLAKFRHSLRCYWQGDLFFLVVQIILPLVYFAGAVYYLNKFGQGAMLNRFANLLLPGQAGFLTIIANFFLHPIFILGQILTKEKLTYLLIILLALGALPLRQRYLYNYLLFGPLLLMNLLSNYPYQHSLVFQYNYGSNALLIYLTALSLHNWQLKLTAGQTVSSTRQREYKRYVQALLTLAVIVSLSVSGFLLKRISYSWSVYQAKAGEINIIKAQLTKIPRDKRILADTFLTSYLADAPELYDLGYHAAKQPDLTIDYVLAYRNLREQEVVNSYRRLGYVEIRELSTDKLLVLKKNA